MPPSSAVPRAVSIRGSTVVKVQEPQASRRERLRTLAGRKVGAETGLFIVPDIVSYDDPGGQIVFERLHLTGLREALNDPARGMETAGRIACVLAAIHSRLETGEVPVTSSAGAKGIDPQRKLVPLHGDFGIANVLYHPDTDRLAVIDWSNSDWTGVDADLAAPEIDVAVLLISLFHRRMFDRSPISLRHKVARHFLTTYASASPHGLDIGSLRAFVVATSPAFARLTRKLKGPIRALAYRHGLVDLDLFLRRLSRDPLASLTG